MEGERPGKRKEASRPRSLRGLGHLCVAVYVCVSNLKFKSFENAVDRPSVRPPIHHEVAPGGKQIFTVSLIHAEERLIDVVHAVLFFLRRARAVQTHTIYPIYIYIYMGNERLCIYVYT